jgi:TP901 family phage tail tape measure protein
MAKKISKSDISEADVFGSLRQSAEEALKDVKKLNEALVEIAEDTAKKLKDVKFDSAKSINEFTKATKDANLAQKEAVKLDAEEAKLKQQLVKITQEEEKLKQQETKTERDLLRTAQANNREKERVIKASLKARKAADDEKNAYKKLVVATRDQKNESKQLAAQMLVLEGRGKKGTAEWRKLEKSYKRVTKAAQTGDAALKKIDSTVGDNFRNVGNYRSALGGLKNMLGGLGVAFGGFQLLKGAGETVSEFGQSVADLQAITGASGEDLEFFKERAIETGTKIEGGAASVIEAYKLIASAKPELLENAAALDQVTQSAILLSQASGLDLPDAATRLTDAMNQFGAPAEQAGLFIDVLANGAKFGAAEIPQVTDALLKFGAVAKTSNVSIQESTAMIEALAEKGLKGAEAGTALRNTMLKLSAPDALPVKAQEAMAKLGISFEDISDTSKPFSERLEAMKPLLDDNAALIQVFGKENAVAAINLLENTERIDELTEKMNTNGTAQEQASTRTETLSGAFLELKNTFNNWIIALNEGAGAGEFLKDLVLGIARNFDKIVFVLKAVIKGFILYKSWLLIITARQKILSMNFKRLGPRIMIFGRNLVKAGKGMLGLNKGMKGASKGVKGFGAALKSIPLIAIIGLVVELATALWDVVTNTDAAAEAAERLAAEAERREAKREADKEKASQRSGARNARLNKELADLDRKRRKDVAENTKTELEANDELLVGKKKILKALGEEVKAEAKASNAVRNTAEKRLAFLRSPDYQALKSNDKKLILNQYKLPPGLMDAQAELQKQIKAEQDAVAALQIEYDSYVEEMKNVNIEEIEAVSTRKKTVAGIKKVNAEFSDQIKLVKELNKLKKEQLDVDKDLSELNLTDDLREQNDALDKAVAARKKQAEEGKTIFTDNSVAANFLGITEISKIKEIIAKKTELNIKYQKEEAQREIDSLKNSYNERFRILQESLDAERKAKLAQEGITPEQIKQVNAGFDREQADLDKVKIESKKVLDGEIKVIERETQNEITEIKKDAAEEQKDIVEDLNETSKEANANNIAEAQKEADELIAAEKAAAERRIEIANAVADAFVEASNKKIAQYDKEIAKASEQLDFLKSAAAQGNIDAKESLAEQQRIIDEANRKKQKEEQKQAKIKLALTAYSAYERNASDPTVQNPLGKTITDITLLKAFISALPAFLEGTENTGKNGMGIDGKGGFQAILHPNERVLTKEQNSMVGNMTNPELASLAMEYQNGKLVKGANVAMQIGQPWSQKNVLDKLKGIEEAIKNKPEHSLAVEDIVTGAMTIARTTKSGGTTTYNRYRVKP